MIASNDPNNVRLCETRKVIVTVQKLKNMHLSWNIFEISIYVLQINICWYFPNMKYLRFDQRSQSFTNQYFPDLPKCAQNLWHFNWLEICHYWYLAEDRCLVFFQHQFWRKKRLLLVLSFTLLPFIVKASHVAMRLD